MPRSNVGATQGRDAAYRPLRYRLLANSASLAGIEVVGLVTRCLSPNPQQPGQGRKSATRRVSVCREQRLLYPRPTSLGATRPEPRDDVTDNVVGHGAQTDSRGQSQLLHGAAGSTPAEGPCARGGFWVRQARARARL